MPDAELASGGVGKKDPEADAKPVMERGVPSKCLHSFNQNPAAKNLVGDLEGWLSGDSKVLLVDWHLWDRNNLIKSVKQAAKYLKPAPGGRGADPPESVAPFFSSLGPAGLLQTEGC